MILNVMVDGVLRERWNDDVVPRLVMKWDADGVLMLDYPRPYTAEENEKADIRTAVEAQERALSNTRDAVRAIINDIKIEMDRCDAVLAHANATSREKDLARSGKRMGAALIDIAKLVKNL